MAVVLSNGQTIHPPHAPVWLAEATAAAPHLEALKDKLKANRRPLDADIARLTSEYEAVKSERRNLNYQGASLADDFRRAEESGNKLFITNAQTALEKCDQERGTLSNKELALERRLTDLETKRAELASQLFLETWPGVLARSATDTDGRFTLAAPAGRKLVVVAVCSGKTEAAVESFQWCVPVTTSNAATLSLTNANRCRLAPAQ